jgi:hypothetical protein
MARTYHSCPGCGKLFGSARGLLSHQSQRFLTAECKRIKPAPGLNLSDKMERALITAYQADDMDANGNGSLTVHVDKRTLMALDRRGLILYKYVTDPSSARPVLTAAGRLAAANVIINRFPDLA